VEGVVIEASGTANPAVIGQMLSDTKLDQLYRMNTLIAVADPLTLPVLFKTLPNIKSQIELADQVILNKIDLAADDIIKQVREMIGRINDRADIIETRFCRLDINPLKTDGKTAAFSSAEAAHPPQPQYARYSLKIAKKLRFDQLDEFVKKHSGPLYRLKGFVRDEKDDFQYVDYSSSGLRTQKCGKPETLSLEFIFDKSKQEIFLDGLKHFHKTAFIKSKA